MITYSTTHLTISDSITFDEWEMAVYNFSRLGSCWQWWLGDILNRGEELFGEKYAQAMESTTMSYKSLANVCYVSKRFRPEERRESLSWSHHKCVAPVDNKKKRQQLLKMAEKDDISVKSLFNLIQQDLLEADGGVKDSLSKVHHEVNSEEKPLEIEGDCVNVIVDGIDSELITGVSVDLTDPTTRRNWEKALKSLKQLLVLRIPNMYLTGTIIEKRLIEVLDALEDAGKG